MLAKHYSHFKVTERTLLTGHSHQAWPDCALAGQQQAWLDAAELVDDKWGLAFAKAQQVRDSFARLLEDTSGYYTLAASTHDLVIRFLSALPLFNRPRIVTTDSEFHSLRRQLQRLQEEGVDVVWVPAHPVATLPERMQSVVDDRTAAVMMSAVFFNSGQIATELSALQTRCQAVGAELLIDVYHALNVIPFTIKGLESAFVVGGGYKYCQLGEGNCFLRFPKDCSLRPIITGWMADFALERSYSVTDKVNFSHDETRFAGSTYDPTAHYRAAEVFDFFVREQLDPVRLRAISQAQMKLMCDEFDKLDLPADIIARNRHLKLEEMAGFMALSTQHAHDIARQLKERQIYTDYRGQVLRLGPAPYVSDEQIRAAIQVLGECCRQYKFSKA